MSSERYETASHVLVSLRPRFAELILSGSKTTEVRRGSSRICPGTVALVYASTPRKALVGAVQIEEVHTHAPSTVWRRWGPTTGLRRREYDDYVDGCRQVTALLLGEPCEFPNPVGLDDLRLRSASFVAPQSYRFVEDAELAVMLNGERRLVRTLEGQLRR